MIDSIIKYFTIIICSFYTFNKLLNLKKPNKFCVFLISIFSLTFATITCILRLYYPYLSLFVMIILSFVFITVLTKTKIELAITTIIISFGISYALFNPASLLTAVILALTKLKELSYGLSIFLMLFQGLFQFFLISVLFKTKRLKKGMPFLINKGSSNIGVLLSTILLCAVITLSNSNTHFVYIVPIVLIILCAIFVLFWWRNKITQTYIDKLKLKEFEDLKLTIKENKERVHYLEQQNEALAKVIHKDNKLIPAMELAIRNYLNSSSQNENFELKAKGEALLNELSKTSQERYGILEKYKNENKKLPLTDVFSIDTLFNYMLNKATIYNIEFDLCISGSIKFMINHVINESELNTLLADLIENAIIATRNTEIKKIIVNIGILNNCYFIDVIDSGVPFQIEIFNKLGIQKATTHKNDGGSGIGMLSTFELVKKANASLIIKEIDINDKSQFSKKISVKFNQKYQYIIESYRNDEIMLLCDRDGIVFSNSNDNYASQ